MLAGATEREDPGSRGDRLQSTFCRSTTTTDSQHVHGTALVELPSGLEASDGRNHQLGTLSVVPGHSIAAAGDRRRRALVGPQPAVDDVPLNRGVEDAAVAAVAVEATAAAVGAVDGGWEHHRWAAGGRGHLIVP